MSSMPLFQLSVRRSLFSVLLFALVSATPTAAAAQSLTYPAAETSDNYLLDPSAGSLSFGNGANGNTPVYSTSSYYGTGGGASGNAPSGWSFGCFLRC